MPRTPKQRRRRATRVKLSKQARLATSMIGEAIDANGYSAPTPPVMPEVVIHRRRYKPRVGPGGRS